MTNLYTNKYPLDNGNVLRVTVTHDECDTTPREWDNLSTLMLHPNKSHWTCKKSFEAKGYESDLLIDLSIARGSSPYEHMDNLIRQQLKLNPSDVIAYPITKYEHGAIRLSLGYQAGWDCSVIGFIFATKEKIRHEYDVKRVTKSILDRVEAAFTCELDDLSSWLNGEIYGFRVEEVAYDQLGDEVYCKLLDSCWGFVGDMDYCISCAEQSAKTYLPK